MQNMIKILTTFENGFTHVTCLRTRTMQFHCPQIFEVGFCEVW